MGFWSDAWNTAKAIGQGVVDVFVGIVSVLVLTVWAIGCVIFSIFEHLYSWIDETIENVKTKLRGTTMVPPEDTEKFISDLNNNKGKTTLPPYKPGVKRSLVVAHNTSGKVVRAQVVSTDSGWEKAIDDAFKKGNLVDQPIEID